MGKIVDLGLPFAVFFSLDRRSVALQNDDGSLRPNGQAFKRFLADRPSA